MEKLKFLIIFITLYCVVSEDNNENTPVVFWHGMGDSCCFPFSLGKLKKLIESELNHTVYVKSLEIGGSLVRDYESSYFIHPQKQIQDACDQIKRDPILSNRTFNAIGFSQGSQFLRALIQKCPAVKVKNLITVGGQHQGVYGLPNCPSLTEKSCEYLRQILNFAAYAGWVQNFLVQATYWHDPMNEDAYKAKSTFLAEINNEKTVNNDYINRLQTLEKFVMIKFANDTIVQPVETSWFGFYKPGSSSELQTLEESEIFLKDRLGLKKMKEDGKIVFLSTEGNHMQINLKWFTENVINNYLRD
ncbi:CLUMA_CG009716, isoform A [Clunio marinus]|uniref:Palmitoyl-protein thioesterase 1 n=1 Tax=Clunio marinus TaxID=568069 RepID=A0A1J1I7Q9_9DIPT|nr:CLUMA_CG009716, isoform A [Clunio marinus]